MGSHSEFLRRGVTCSDAVTEKTTVLKNKLVSEGDWTRAEAGRSVQKLLLPWSGDGSEHGIKP